MRDEESQYQEPPYFAGLNDLGEVLEASNVALDKPERFTSAELSALAKEIEVIAQHFGVYEPLDSPFRQPKRRALLVTQCYLVS